MRNPLIWVIPAATLFLQGAARASEEIPDLYSAEVSVTGQREETRAPAVLQGFRDVLVKVSGDQRLLADPRLDGLYDKASPTSFSYRDLMAGIPKHDEQGTRDRPYVLTVHFDPAKIDATLLELGRKPWDAERPKVAIFVAVELAASKYVIPDKGDPGELQRQSLQMAARRYGVPVAFPSADVLRMPSTSYESLRDPNLEELNAAAKAAGSDVALAGIMVFSDKIFGWIVEWRLLAGGATHRWQIQGVNFDEAFRNAMRGAAQILSGNGDPD